MESGGYWNNEKLIKLVKNVVKVVNAKYTIMCFGFLITVQAKQLLLGMPGPYCE